VAKRRDLRRFSDQPVAEIVQCGEPLLSASPSFVVLVLSSVASRLGFASREWHRVLGGARRLYARHQGIAPGDPRTLLVGAAILLATVLAEALREE
jgi:hypothetical protein